MLPQMPTNYYNPPATTRRPSKGFKYGKKSVKYNGIKYKTYPEGNKLRRYYFRFFPLGKEITIDNLHKFNKNAKYAFNGYQLNRWQVAGEDNLNASTTAKILFNNQTCLNTFFDQSDEIDADKYCQIICAQTELKQLLLSKNTTQKVCQQTICKNQDLVELLYRSHQLTNEEKGDLLVANPEIIPTVFNTTVLTYQQVIEIICSCEALQRIVFESEGGNLECAKCICKQPNLIARLLNLEGYRQQTISMISKIFIKEPSLISCYTPLGDNGLSLPDLIEIVSLAPQLISTIFSFEHIKPEQCAHFIEKLQQTGLTPLFTRNQINKFNDEYQTKTKNHHSLKSLGTTAVKPNQEYQFLANYLLLMLASNPEYLCATCRCLENNPLRLINGYLYITLDKNFFAVTSKDRLTPTPLLATAKHKNIHSLSYFELVQPLTGEHEEIFSSIATLMKDTSDMLNEPMQETKTAQHQRSCEDKISYFKAVQATVEILKKLLAEEVTKLTSQSASLSRNDSGTHLFSLETSNQAADGKTHSGSMEREAFLLQETLKIYQNLQSSYENYSHQINQTIHNLQDLLQSLKQLHNSSKQGEKVDILATLDVLSSVRQNIVIINRCSTGISKLNNLATQSMEAAKDHTQPNANTSVHSTATDTNDTTDITDTTDTTDTKSSSTASIDITKAGKANTTSSPINITETEENANTNSSPTNSPNPSIASLNITKAGKANTTSSPTKSLNSSTTSMDSLTTSPNPSTPLFNKTETDEKTGIETSLTKSLNSSTTFIEETGVDNAKTTSSPTKSLTLNAPTQPLNSSTTSTDSSTTSTDSLTTSTDSLTTSPNPSTPPFNKTETDENTGIETSLTKSLNSSTTPLNSPTKPLNSSTASMDSSVASHNITEAAENTQTNSPTNSPTNSSPASSPTNSLNSSIAPLNITETGNANAMSSSTASIDITETENTDASAALGIQDYLQKFISTFTAFETIAQRIRNETPNKAQASSYSSGELILLVNKLKKYLAEGNEADSDTLFIKGVDNKLSEMKTTLDENKVDDEISKQILTISTMWESIKSLEIPSGELSKALATATEVAKQPTATPKRTSVNLNSPATQKKDFYYSNYLPDQPNPTLFRSKSMQNLTGNGKSKNKGNNQPELGRNQLTRLAIKNLKQALKEKLQKTQELTSTYQQLNGQMDNLYLLLYSINGENNNNARLAFTNKAKEIFNQLVTSIQQFEPEAEDTDAVKTAKENLEIHFNSLISSLSHDNQSQMGSTIDDSTPDNGKTTLASPSSNKLLDDNELRTPRLEVFHTAGSVAPKGTQLVTGVNDNCPPNFLENVLLTTRTKKLKRSQSLNLGLNDNCPPDDLASNTTKLQRIPAAFVLGRSNEFSFIIKKLTFDED